MKKPGLMFTAAFAALVASGVASAQFVWLDDKGMKQYSDMPPPGSVPQSRILKSPGKEIKAPVQPNAPAAEGTQKSGVATEKTPLTAAEKNAEFQKRRAEQAEKDKKATEQEKLAADKAKNCERAREYQRTLESGVRIARSDKDGERTFISDDERARELREARTALQDCKS